MFFFFILFTKLELLPLKKIKGATFLKVFLVKMDGGGQCKNNKCFGQVMKLGFREHFDDIPSQWAK